MPDPATTALTSALDNSTKVANTPLFATVIDRLLGFKISEWSAQGDVIKKQILDGYEDAKQKGLGVQYVSAFRSNANLINTSIKAAKYITTEREGDIEMDNDVFWGLIEHSKTVSSEEVQELIAKILAGEYNSPGTYSMSTLQILKSLGKENLEKLAFFSSFYLLGYGFLKDLFSMEESALTVRKEVGMNYSDFLELQNLGLVQAGDYTMQVNVAEGELVGFHTNATIHAFKATRELKNWRFPSCYKFTDAGNQISQHLIPVKSQVFEEWLVKFFVGKGFELISSKAKA